MSMYFMLLRGFPALFRLFWLGKFHHSTTRFRTCLRNRAHRPFLAPWCALPHPLQNRVPRVRVLLPLPQNRQKHCVSAGFLFTCVVWLWCSHWFRQRLFASVCPCLQPFSSSPAPKTHPVLPIFGFSGCVFVFFALLDAQNFQAGFCAL